MRIIKFSDKFIEKLEKNGFWDNYVLGSIDKPFMSVSSHRKECFCKTNIIIGKREYTAIIGIYQKYNFSCNEIKHKNNGQLVFNLYANDLLISIHNRFSTNTIKSIHNIERACPWIFKK